VRMRAITPHSACTHAHLIIESVTQLVPDHTANATVVERACRVTREAA
jgi:hypothetical protein